MRCFNFLSWGIEGGRTLWFRGGIVGKRGGVFLFVGSFIWTGVLGVGETRVLYFGGRFGTQLEDGVLEGTGLHDTLLVLLLVLDVEHDRVGVAKGVAHSVPEANSALRLVLGV